MPEVTKVPDAVARTARGFGQGGAGWVIVEAIEAFNIYDFNDKQYGLAVVVLGTVVSYLQNLVENKIGVGFLRTVPAKDQPIVTVDEAKVEPSKVLLGDGEYTRVPADQLPDGDDLNSAEVDSSEGAPE